MPSSESAVTLAQADNPRPAPPPATLRLLNREIVTLRATLAGAARGADA